MDDVDKENRPDMHYQPQVERWCVFEVTFSGKANGNPFVDYEVKGTFVGKHEQVTVPGFYDGNGLYKLRFMPSFESDYTYTIHGTAIDEPIEGKFIATAARADNHGLVRARGHHFEYEDGRPYFPVGTTCYVWALQNHELQQMTLKTLGEHYFNKIRYCVMPKHYLYNLHEPITYPYEGTPCVLMEGISDNIQQLMAVQPGNEWDFSILNPQHFRGIEESIKALGELGIEADLILFHPYDRWGFSHMTAEQDELYLRYVIARFSAYKNVWWSMANEYDLLQSKSISDWERLAEILVDNDPYKHLRSIHNCRPMYDYSRPWITHCSIQRQDLYKCAEYTNDFRIRFGKPVVLDEIAYEGDIDQGWGNISGQELVRRFWEAAVRGGYASHGETYDRGDDVLWWSHGGKLYGESQQRLKFLHTILCQTPGSGLEQSPGAWDEVVGRAEGLGASGYYLYYFGFCRPSGRRFALNPEHTYHAEVIDTWDMTISDAGNHSGVFTISLPRKQYMAVRFRRVLKKCLHA